MLDVFGAENIDMNSEGAFSFCFQNVFLLKFEILTYSKKNIVKRLLGVSIKFFVAHKEN